MSSSPLEYKLSIHAWGYCLVAFPAAGTNIFTTNKPKEEIESDFFSTRPIIPGMTAPPISISESIRRTRILYP